MKQIRHPLAAILLSVPIAYFAAAGWWHAWMYQGWLGPPGVLHPHWPQPVDGEASYDAAFAEMFVTAGVCSLMLYALFWWLHSRRSAQRIHRDAA